MADNTKAFELSDDELENVSGGTIDLFKQHFGGWKCRICGYVSATWPNDDIHPVPDVPPVCDKCGAENSFEMVEFVVGPFGE